MFGRSSNIPFCKEICFCNEVLYDRERFEKYVYSKGGMQNAIKNNYEPVISKLEGFNNMLNDLFKDGMKEAIFSYKIKIGVK